MKHRKGAATNHSCKRLFQYCGFRGTEEDAKKLIAICRRVAGRNGNVVISPKNLGIEQKDMHGIEPDKHYVPFVDGQAITILSLLGVFGRRKS